MKVLKSTLLAFFVTALFVQVNAAPNNTIDPQEKLEKQIAKLVANADYWGNIKRDQVFKACLTINAQGEIIVLSTTDSKWDHAIKTLLNYQKIEVDAKFYNKIFILPIHLIKDNS